MDEEDILVEVDIEEEVEVTDAEVEVITEAEEIIATIITMITRNRITYQKKY